MLRRDMQTNDEQPQEISVRRRIDDHPNDVYLSSADGTTPGVTLSP